MMIYCDVLHNSVLLPGFDTRGTVSLRPSTSNVSNDTGKIMQNPKAFVQIPPSPVVFCQMLNGLKLAYIRDMLKGLRHTQKPFDPKLSTHS